MGKKTKSPESKNTIPEMEKSSELLKPDPNLVSRPRMGRYSNVAEGGEDILIRIIDWLDRLFERKTNSLSKKTS